MLDPSSHVPAYIQIKQYYLKKIQSQELVPGQKLPTEQEISNAWNLSKMTVRQGLQQLVKEGFVRSQRGVGTFVANTPMLFDTLQFTSFSSRKRDRLTQTKVLVFEKRTINSEDSLKYFKKIYNHVWYFERLRYLDNQPAQYEISLMPFEMFPKLSKKELEKSKYQYVLQTEASPISSCERSFSAIISSKEISQILKVKEGAAILKVESFGFLSNGIIFEYVSLFHHPELCLIKGHSPFVASL